MMEVNKEEPKKSVDDNTKYQRQNPKRDKNLMDAQNEKIVIFNNVEIVNYIDVIAKFSSSVDTNENEIKEDNDDEDINGNNKGGDTIKQDMKPSYEDGALSIKRPNVDDSVLNDEYEAENEDKQFLVNGNIVNEENEEGHDSNYTVGDGDGIAIKKHDILPLKRDAEVDTTLNKKDKVLHSKIHKIDNHNILNKKDKNLNVLSQMVVDSPCAIANEKGNVLSLKQNKAESGGIDLNKNDKVNARKENVIESDIIKKKHNDGHIREQSTIDKRHNVNRKSNEGQVNKQSIKTNGHLANGNEGDPDEDEDLLKHCDRCWILSEK
ncbi:unnamed protein product, partial [Owenia fusiformis]